MKNEKKRPSALGLILWGLLAVAVVLIILMFVVKKKPEVVEAVESRPVPVSVVTLGTRDLPDVVSLPGRIEAFVQAELAAEKPGRIMRIDVEKGDTVKTDQLLIQIDDSLWRTGLRRAEVEHREAAKDLARWEALKESGAISDSELDGARTRMDMAEASLEEYRVHVEKCRILSPMKGIVNNRFVDVGEYINEGAPALQVVDIDTVKLIVDIPEQDVLSISQGEEIPFRVASLQNQSFTGKVAFVAVQADAHANAFKTEIHADNAGHGLRPGMIAEVSLARSAYRDAVVVPLNAVIPRKGEHVVFVAEGDHAALRVVRMRSIVGHEAVLTSGVGAGDRLIVEGHRSLEDGVPITVVP